MFTAYAFCRFLLSSQLLRDALVLLDAMLSPGRVLREVEEMRALQLEADRIEKAQPVRAAYLRRQAARIGLA